MSPVCTLDEAAERLHKGRRWLQDWLGNHPADRFGNPFFAQLGRSKVFTDDDLSRTCKEEQQCRSKSTRRARPTMRRGSFAAPTLGSGCIEALALARKHSPRGSDERSSATSNVVRLPERQQPGSEQRQRRT